MANLTVVAADVHSVRLNGPNDLITGPAVETIAAGQYCRLDTTTGKIALGNASDAAESRDGGIALNGGIAGVTITIQRGGIVDLGDALGDLTYDDEVFLSDTDGALADAAGTVSKIVGVVVPAFGTTTPDKLLLLKDL